MIEKKRDGSQPFWTSKRVLLIALALSMAAHVMAYIASHDWAFAWNAENLEAQLDTRQTLTAVLLPANNSMATDAHVAAPVAAEVNTRLARPRSATRRAVAISASILVAPADTVTSAITNPIAVDIVDATSVTAEAIPTPIHERMAEPVRALPPAVIPLLASTPAAPPVEPANTAPPLLFPQRIRMAYRLSSSVADGIANFSWQRNGSQYELNSTMQATGIFAGLFVGTFRQTSRGEITPDGIRPVFFSMRRGETPADTAEFNLSKQELKIIKHGETHLFPLPPRMQDTQSFLFQLAQDAYKLKTGDGRLKVALTNARKLYDYQFRLVGQETLPTRMGELMTLHIKSDAADPEDVYEVWLSPKHYYLPVKAKFYIGRFLMEQTVTSISASDP